MMVAMSIPIGSPFDDELQTTLKPMIYDSFIDHFNSHLDIIQGTSKPSITKLYPCPLGILSSSVSLNSLLHLIGRRGSMVALVFGGLLSAHRSGKA